MFNDKKLLKSYLLRNQKQRKINIFFDIETLMYNKHMVEVTKHPTDYKNITYSFCCGIYDENDNLLVFSFLNFPEFVNFVVDSGFKSCKNSETSHNYYNKIALVGFNSNKYDNHYLFRESRIFLDDNISCFNMSNGLKTENRSFETPIKKVSPITLHNGCFFEKRVKAGNNLAFRFYYKGVLFESNDIFNMYQISLKTVGMMLFRINALSLGELKTDFDYEEFDLDDNMGDLEALKYATSIYKKLNFDHKKYIRNDILITANAYSKYDELFPGFSIEESTKTRNIINSYTKDNPLCEFQLLNKFKFPDGKKLEINYTNFVFNNMNLYDYFRRFYKGGLNLYNDEYIGKIINNCFSADEISAYPFAMHNYDTPMFIKEYDTFSEETHITYNEKIFTLFEIDKDTFNDTYLAKIKSKMIRKAFVKYYANFYTSVYVTSYTIKLLSLFMKCNIKSVPSLSYIKFDSTIFYGRDKIAKYFTEKTKAKYDHEITFSDPYHYKENHEKKSIPLSPGEVYLYKVNMNGIYGAPALSPTYDTFYRDEEDKLFNIPNNYFNTQRNILFSLSVTSIAFFNLLFPLTFYEDEEIDTWFVYSDTDSLYLKDEAYHKFISNIKVDDYTLGAWSIDDDVKYIKNIYVLNHKKYCYEDSNNNIVVKAGGITSNTFDKKMSFEKFIETQFHDGTILTMKKAITNKQGVISIYNSDVLIKKGNNYATFFSQIHTKTINDIRHTMMGDLHEHFYDIDNFDDVIYIETSHGVLSRQDLLDYKFPKDGKAHIMVLKRVHSFVKKNIFNILD